MAPSEQAERQTANDLSVAGRRSQPDLAFRPLVTLDREYIDDSSQWLDFKILANPLVVVKRTGVQGAPDSNDGIGNKRRGG